MLKKSITYTDFDGDEQTEDFYFNLTKAELVEMELTAPGQSFRDAMQKIVSSKDGKTIMAEFKKLILQSYGIKSDDGKRFIKSEQISTDFLNSAAYSVLFVELTQDAGAAAEWITGLMPSDMQDGVRSAAEARRRSEQQLQGHKPKAATSSVTKEAELPTVSPEEEAQIDADPRGADDVTEEDLSKLTKAQLLERLKSR
jgi:hypothetical protein